MKEVQSISPLTVALIVVARNADKDLPALLQAVEAQTYPRHQVEMILVDSCSKDTTPLLFAGFSDEGWLRVRRLRNDSLSLAAGWNLAIRNASSRVLVRLDAHALPRPDFLERLVCHVEQGENIVGGIVQCAGGENRLSRVIVSLETSVLGAAAAAFRRAGQMRYVDTVAYAAYRREVFETVGLFIPSLSRNQDNEFHARCRSAGFRFLLDPSITVAYQPRNRLWPYLVQKASNGFWLSRALYHNRGSCRLRHLVPAALLAGLLALLVLKWPVALLAALIHVSLLFFSLGTSTGRLAISDRCCSCMLGVVIHYAYGAGTIGGFLSLPGYLFAALSERGNHGIEFVSRDQHL